MQSDAVSSSAIAYAEAGLLVFPSPPGTKTSYKSKRWHGGYRWGATRDPLQVRYDFEYRYPQANVCIVTGKDNGLWVMDIDAAAINGHSVDGFARLNELERDYGPLPLTRQAETPSGGRHYYFMYPNDGRIIRNDTMRKLGSGIDIRGDGGMVVAPPSAKGDKRYRWLNCAHIGTAPDWLLNLVAQWPLPPRAEAEELGVVDPATIAAMVAVIPPQLDWQQRNSIGMAIWRASEGSQAGFEIWDAWLQRSGRYSAPDARRRWMAITQCPPTNIGAGTLFYLANKAQPQWEQELARAQFDAIMTTNREACNASD